MKSFRKLTLWTLTVVAVIALAVFGVACEEQSKSVSLTFETNGGTAVATVTVNEGETVTLPTTQKVGAEFAGWYDNADFNGAAVTTVQATENKTYYAKWEQLYLVTLNADGGSLETTSVYVKSGAVIYDAISALVPTKENRQFGAWLKGETELGRNDRMSAQDITLTAKYKVMYTVEMYEQEEDGEGYQLAETITEYEYAGVNKNDQRRLTGFKEVANDNTVTSLTIDEDVQKNVFKHYFDREQFRLTLNPNYPDKTVAENLGLAKNYEVLYGSDFTPDYFEFSLEGYYLEGWARSAKGEVAYATNYMLAHLENGEGETAEPDKVEIEQNTALFAVWRQGRTDMFGGSDYLYVFDETGYFIYLERGGKFFVGDFVPTKRSFSFVDDKDDPLLGGRLVGDAGYCYGDSNRFSNPYTLFEVGSGLNENVQVLFDSLNGITYTVKNDTATSDDSKGEYVIDENGEYVVTFTEGSLTGKTYHLLLGTVSAANSDTVNAFRVRNEEEYAMPELVRYSITNTGSISYLIAYQIKLDGYGNATIYTDTEHSQSQTYRYAYNKDSDTYALSDSNGNTVLTFKVFNHAVYMATIGYFAYNESLDKEFTSETGSLVLDGYYQATYVDENGNEQKGY
ncbi:MAG: InlB B-repeat-containing protein, partial [Clostridia bacterium]|nr:InlB B-repeat-containing protein [Clostridia bacterium]